MDNLGELSDIFDEIYLEFRLHGHDISREYIEKIFDKRDKDTPITINNALLPFFPASLYNIPGITEIILYHKDLSEEFISKTQPPPDGVVFVLPPFRPDYEARPVYNKEYAQLPKCKFIKSLAVQFYYDFMADILSQMSFIEHLKIKVKETKLDVEPTSNISGGGSISEYDSDILDLDILSKFINLRSLELDHVEIKSFPSFMLEFKNLIGLKFSYFEKPLPLGLENMINLERLYLAYSLHNNQLNNLGKLTKLKNLSIWGGEFFELHEDFNNLTYLQEVTLNRLKQHTEISIQKLDNLEILTLYDCIK